MHRDCVFFDPSWLVAYQPHHVGLRNASRSGTSGRWRCTGNFGRMHPGIPGPRRILGRSGRRRWLLGDLERTRPIDWQASARNRNRQTRWQSPWLGARPGSDCRPRCADSVLSRCTPAGLDRMWDRIPWQCAHPRSSTAAQHLGYSRWNVRRTLSRRCNRHGLAVRSASFAPTPDRRSGMLVRPWTTQSQKSRIGSCWFPLTTHDERGPRIGPLVRLNLPCHAHRPAYSELPAASSPLSSKWCAEWPSKSIP